MPVSPTANPDVSASSCGVAVHGRLGLMREQPGEAIKRGIKACLRMMGYSLSRLDRARSEEARRHAAIASRFRQFTMVPEVLYLDNLRLASRVRDIPGDVVECGVWRGGMSAGIATLLGQHRDYWLFDSFQGLPPAQPIDGESAIRYQSDPSGPWYFDNCTAEEGYAQRAMALSEALRVHIVKGWFHETVHHAEVDRIALLRLDGDWYESTMTCLEAFYPKVVPGGLTIIDDYYTWDGCARAVHDYLSRNGSADRIQQSEGGNAYIMKSS